MIIDHNKRVMLVKKWFLIISFVVIIIITISTIIYLNAIQPLKSAEEKAIEIAMAETPLTVVDEFNIYNGEETYYVLQGKNEDGTKLIVWVPEEKGKLMVKKASDGITKKQAIDTVSAEIATDSIITVKLGMEKGIPLWEVHSRTKGHLLNYYSVEFKTGKWLKKIENL
jgi:uncharacterized protein YpmB